MTKITNINKIIFRVEADGSSGTVPSDEFYGEIIKNQLQGEGKSTVPNWKKHVKVCEDLMLLTENDQNITLAKDGEEYYKLILVEDGKKMLSSATDGMKKFLVEKIMQKKYELQKKIESSIVEYTMGGNEQISLIRSEEIKKNNALDELLAELELVETFEREAPPNFYDSAGMSEEDHWKRLEAQRRNGKSAEIKTVQREKERLKQDHQFDDELLDKVKRISESNTSAGYDIDSFNGEKFIVDRHIEVKCTTGKYPIFYWSENEIEKARELKNQYFIYLWINFGKEGERLLDPIQNPYHEIYENESIKKEPKTIWRISLNEQN